MSLVILIAVPAVAFPVVTGFFVILGGPRWMTLLENHFAAIVGLPMAALLSAFIVVSLRQTEGQIEFKGLGFTFNGASGQVVLWVLCFLSIAVAIKLLWNL